MPGDQRLLLSLRETRWAIHIRTRRFIADAVRRALLFLKLVVEVGAALRILPILTMLCLLLVFIGSHHIFSPPLYTKNYLRQPYAFDPRRLQPPTPLSSSTIFLLRLFFALLCVSFVGTSIFFYKSMFSNPRLWSLEELKHQTEVLGRKPTFCYKCRRYRPARTHHCRYCDKYVAYSSRKRSHTMTYEMSWQGACKEWTIIVNSLSFPLSYSWVLFWP